MHRYEVTVSFRHHQNSAERIERLVSVSAPNQELAKFRAAWVLGFDQQPIVFDSVQITARRLS